MKKLSVLTVIGTRPEIIRLSRVIAALDRTVSHTLVHTGQNYDYELNQVFFDELKIRKPDFFLEAAGTSVAETIGNMISRIDPILERVSPDAFLILGDTNSALCAISAKRRKVPVFHMEAGNRCFDERVPEEINRRIVDHIADINLPYSDISREYLLREGVRPDRIIKTGSPMFEVLAHHKHQIELSSIIERLHLTKGNYFVVSLHREENVDNPSHLTNLVRTLDEIAARYSLPILFSTHPRTRARLDSSGIQIHPLVQLHKPFGFIDYVQLQMNARLVLSDSGTINEESSILGFRALNVREAHERPEGMEEAAVILTGLDSRHILRCIEYELARDASSILAPVSDYSIPNVSEKVARIILSYTPYIRKTVWGLAG